MILTCVDLEPYRQLSVRSMPVGRGGFAPRTYQAAVDAEMLVHMEYGANLPFYVAEQHHSGRKSITRLAQELGMDDHILRKILDYFSIPRLTSAETSARNAESGIGMFALTKEQRQAIGRINGKRAAELGIGIHGINPETGESYSRIGGKRAAELGRGAHGTNPATGESYRDIGRRRSAELGVGIHALTEEQRQAIDRHNAELGVGIYGINPETGESYSRIGGKRAAELGVGIHALTEEQRQAIGKRAAELGIGVHAFTREQRQAIGIRAGKRIAELGVGIYGINPTTGRRYGEDNLPTRHGYRHDIHFYARSTWEANIARMLLHLGFSIEPHTEVILNVGESERDLFTSATTTYSIDFRAVSPHGQMYYYEIIAHPREDPDGIAKARMFQEQHPDKKLIVITGEKYHALASSFAERVRANPRFSGWETKVDNLRTNPERYGAP